MLFLKLNSAFVLHIVTKQSLSAASLFQETYGLECRYDTQWMSVSALAGTMAAPLL